MIKILLKKRPVILLLVVGVLVLYSIVNYQQQVNYLRDTYGETILYKERRMVAMISLSRMLGEAQMFDELRAQLEDARENEMIDFYILQYKGKALWHGSYDGDLAVLDREYTVLDQPLVTPHATFETLRLAGDYKLTLGFGKDSDAYVERNMERFRAGLYSDAIYYVGIVLLVSLWAFWDFFRILGKLKSGRGADISSIQTRSRESEMFLRGFQSYEKSLNLVENENKVLDAQVLPSLRGELASGRVPPYDFDCTLVRCDINNFTAVYSSDHKKHFMATINEFFSEVSHIVSRYEGCIHEFVGDEVLFYFKDEKFSGVKHKNSFAMALSAVRDIEVAARAIHVRVLREQGYAFTVKSSLARGSLTFGPLLNGFSLSGGVLIETVRVLSHVAEKDGNVAFFDSTHRKHVNERVMAAEAMKVALKGLSGERTLMRVESQKSLAETLGNLNLSNVGELAFYRSDESMASILAAVSSLSDEKLVLAAIGEMKAVKTTRFDAGVLTAIETWIDSNPPSKILASVISLIPNLIPPQSLPESLAGRLVTMSEMKDSRVVANALDTLAHFSESTSERIQHTHWHADNRVAANALVLEGRASLTPKFIKTLRRQLKASNSARLASAIYALGEIAAHHKNRDLVYFSTQADLQDLLSDLPKWREHKDESVRRQAELALKKLGALDTPARSA